MPDGHPVCPQCGYNRFVPIPEGGRTSVYCGRCAHVFRRDYAPVKQRCPECNIVKPMKVTQVTETLTSTQRVCDDCTARNDLARGLAALWRR